MGPALYPYLSHHCIQILHAVVGWRARKKKEKRTRGKAYLAGKVADDIYGVVGKTSEWLVVEIAPEGQWKK